MTSNIRNDTIKFKHQQLWNQPEAECMFMIFMYNDDYTYYFGE